MSLQSDPTPKTIIELVRAFPNYIRDLSDFHCEKQIGKGGFGTVWKGRDLKTGKLVAVKEMLTKRKGGRAALTRYIREAYTMAITNCRFVVPLVGFTAEPPYAIITEYMEHGDLSTYVFNKKDNTSGTHKTSIAVCLAYTLAHIHSLGIVYRDLKTSNILMDDNQLPRLCDFGISRIYTPTSILTPRLGTPQYMAPEVYGDLGYDQKCDVYGFAMILYEMNEAHPPYPGLKFNEVKQTVVLEQERPPFVKTPLNFQRLIKRMWDPDPKYRPTSEEIWQEFAKCKIMFPNTDKKKIQKLVSNIEDNDKKRKQNGKELPPIYVDIKQILSQLEGKPVSESDDEPEEEEPEWNPKIAAPLKSSASTPEVPLLVLSQPNSSAGLSIDAAKIKNFEAEGWAQYIIEISKQVQPSEFPIYYPILSQLIKKVSHQQQIIIYKAIATTMEKQSKFVDYIGSQNFFATLQGLNPKVCPAAAECMIQLAHYRPYLMTMTLSSVFRELINHAPHEMIICFSYYIKELPSASVSVPILDVFIQSHPAFDKVIDKLMICIAMISMKNPDYCSIRGPLLNQIFSRGFIQNFDAAIYSACPIASYLQIDFEILIKNYREDLASAYTSLLIRLPKLPASRRLAELIINLAEKSELGNYLLIQFISMSIECAKLVVENESWYTKALPTVDDTFRLLTAIFCIRDLRQVVADKPSFIPMMSNFIKSQNPLVVSGITSILRRVSITNIEPWQNFIKEYITMFKSTLDINIVRNGVTLIDFFSRLGDSPSYIEIVPKLMDILKVYQDLFGAVITIFTIFSQYPSCQAGLVAPLGDYFKSLLQYPDYRPLAETFLKNCNIPYQ